MRSEVTAARGILGAPGFRLIIDDTDVTIEALDPTRLANFIQVGMLLIGYGHYRQKAESASQCLTDVQDGDLAALLAKIRHFGHAVSAQRFDRGLPEVLAAIERLADSAERECCRQLLACYGKAIAYRDRALGAIDVLSERVVAAFDGLQAEARTTFQALRPILTELMGRPTDAGIDAAIAQVEAAEETFNGIRNRFKGYLLALSADERRLPDPTRSLTAGDNPAKLEQLRYQLATIIQDDSDTVDRIIEAVHRGAGMILNLVTAIQQVDQRLQALGVS